MGNPDALVPGAGSQSGALSMSRIVHLSSVHDALYSRIFHKKCRAAADAGHEVTVIAPHARSCTIDGVRIIAIRPYRSRILRMALATPEVFRKAAFLRADLYHVEDPELLPWAVLLRWWTGAPVVYDAMEYHREAILWKYWVPKPLRPLIALVTDRVEKRCVRHLDGVVVVNPHMKSLFDSCCPRVAVAHNFPWRRWIPEIEGRRDPNMLVCLGAFTCDRGYELLLDTMELVRRKNSQAYCTVVGSVIRNGMKAVSLEKERALVDQEALRFAGEVEYKDIWQYLFKASIGLIPFLRTPNNEMGLPNKLFEYMGASLPVVAPGLRFISAIVESAQCGILVQADHPEDYANAIVSLLGNPQLRSTMGERGRKAILNQYNFETEARAMLALYDTVLGRSSPELAVSSPAESKIAPGLPEEAGNIR